MKIRFMDKEHKAFFARMMAKSQKQDCYHQALFYTLGLNPDTRANVDSLFDFKMDWIMPEHFHAPWQTGGSYRVTRMAFNLWNGWAEEGHEKSSTPDEMFDCGYASYFFEAVKLRYPEYCVEFDRPAPDRSGVR